MKLNNLLSVNPATSGGVGIHKKTNCSCSKKSSVVGGAGGNTVGNNDSNAGNDVIGDINVGSTDDATAGDVPQDWWRFNNSNIQTYTSGFSDHGTGNYALKYQHSIGLGEEYSNAPDDENKLMQIDYDLSGTIRQTWTKTQNKDPLAQAYLSNYVGGNITVTITNSKNSANMKSSQVGNNIIQSTTNKNWHSQTETTTTTRSRSVGDEYGSRSTATQHSKSTTTGVSTTNTVGLGSSSRFSSGSKIETGGEASVTFNLNKKSGKTYWVWQQIYPVKYEKYYATVDIDNNWRQDEVRWAIQEATKFAYWEGLRHKHSGVDTNQNEKYYIESSDRTVENNNFERMSGEALNTFITTTEKLYNHMKKNQTMGDDYRTYTRWWSKYIQENSRLLEDFGEQASDCSAYKKCGPFVKQYNHDQDDGARTKGFSISMWIKMDNDSNKPSTNQRMLLYCIQNQAIKTTDSNDTISSTNNEAGNVSLFLLSSGGDKGYDKLGFEIHHADSKNPTQSQIIVELPDKAKTDLQSRKWIHVVATCKGSTDPTSTNGQRLTPSTGLEFEIESPDANPVCQQWNHAIWNPTTGLNTDWTTCSVDGYYKNVNLLAKCEGGIVNWVADRSDIYKSCVGGDMVDGDFFAGQLNRDLNIYVNGEELTTNSSNPNVWNMYENGNFNELNGMKYHYIGRKDDNSRLNFKGHMSDVHYLEFSIDEKDVKRLYYFGQEEYDEQQRELSGTGNTPQLIVPDFDDTGKKNFYRRFNRVTHPVKIKWGEKVTIVGSDALHEGGICEGGRVPRTSQGTRTNDTTVVNNKTRFRTKVVDNVGNRWSWWNTFGPGYKGQGTYVMDLPYEGVSGGNVLNQRTGNNSCDSNFRRYARPPTRGKEEIADTVQMHGLLDFQRVRRSLPQMESAMLVEHHKILHMFGRNIVNSGTGGARDRMN